MTPPISLGPEPTLWGIHSGRTGDADRLFLERKVVALGWAKLGGLSPLTDREAFKAAVAVAYPEKKPGPSPTTPASSSASCARWR